MTIWFEASGWNYTPKIKPVNVTKETECFIVVDRGAGWGSSRCAKVSQSERYFQTWEAARDFLMEKVTERVRYARETLEKANASLGNVKGWKNPNHSSE